MTGTIIAFCQQPIKKNFSFWDFRPMFYVEHQMKYLFFIAFALFLASCNKKDPNPELSDPIYKDLTEELGIASKALEDEEKNLASLMKEKDQAVPQTGQIKYATKKVYDSQARVDVLRQQKQFFEIKIELRKHEVQQRYAESLKEGGRPWPDQAEIATYMSVAKFQRDKIEYEKNKGIKKSVPRGTSGAGAEKAPEGGHEGGHEAAPAESEH